MMLYESDNDEEDEDECCPLCIEALDEKRETQRFFPCPCNYRVCMFCVRRIQTEFDGRCPGCRRGYVESGFRFVDKPVKKKAVVKRLKKNVLPAPGPVVSGNSYIGVEGVVRKDLSNVRVVQRNLVYLVGLAPSIAKEDTLRSKDFFGQYGKIVKVAINRNDKEKDGVPSYSAYITFLRDDDAKSAIKAVNGFWVDNYVIKASFGTTKYCNMFLRGLQCTNPDCLYLHKLGDDASSFTKEEMQAGRANFHDMTQVLSKGGVVKKEDDDNPWVAVVSSATSTKEEDSISPPAKGGGGWAAAAAAASSSLSSVAKDGNKQTLEPLNPPQGFKSTSQKRFLQPQQNQSLLSLLGGLPYKEFICLHGRGKPPSVVAPGPPSSSSKQQQQPKSSGGIQAEVDKAKAELLHKRGVNY